MKFDFWTMYAVVFLGFAFCNEFTFIFKPADVVEATLRNRADLPLNDLAWINYVTIVIGLASLIGAVWNNPFKDWFLCYTALGLIHYSLVRIWPPWDVNLWFVRIDGVLCVLLLITMFLKLINKFPVLHETVSHQA